MSTENPDIRDHIDRPEAEPGEGWHHVTLFGRYLGQVYVDVGPPVDWMPRIMRRHGGYGLMWLVLAVAYAPPGGEPGEDQAEETHP